MNQTQCAVTNPVELTAIAPQRRRAPTQPRYVQRSFLRAPNSNTDYDHFIFSTITLLGLVNSGRKNLNDLTKIMPTTDANNVLRALRRMLYPAVVATNGVPTVSLPDCKLIRYTVSSPVKDSYEVCAIIIYNHQIITLAGRVERITQCPAHLPKHKTMNKLHWTTIAMLERHPQNNSQL